MSKGTTSYRIKDETALLLDPKRWQTIKEKNMSKKIEINFNNDSKEIRIEMNRRGIDHLMMKLDRLRAKMSGEYNLSNDKNDVEIKFKTGELVNEIAFELKK